MKRCTVCGLAEQDNEAHGSEYKGIGAHSFTEVDATDTKSATDVLGGDDMFVYHGGEIKAVESTEEGKGAFEGYLVRFSDAGDPDLVGDFFTKATEFYVEDGAVIPVLYDHGLNATIKGTKIGRANIKYDDVGVFIKGELDLRNKYVKAVYEKLVKEGKAGLSSGAARHMVQRKSIKSGVHEMERWGIAEGSITVAPTEPKCEVAALKAYAIDRVDPFQTDDEDEGYRDTKTIKEEGGKFILYSQDGKKNLGTHDSRAEAIVQEIAIDKAKKTIAKKSVTPAPEDDILTIVKAWLANNPFKGMFQDKLKEKVPSIWEIRSTLDDVYRDIAAALLTSNISEVEIDVEAKCLEACQEEASLEAPLAAKQIRAWVEKGYSGREGERFYIRSIAPSALKSIEGRDLVTECKTLNEHSATVVSALEEFVAFVGAVDTMLKAYSARCDEKIEFRANDPLKAGRVLSADTLTKLTSINEALGPMLESLNGHKTQLTALIEKATPKSKEEKSATDTLMLEFEYTRHQTETALMDNNWPS